MTDGWFDADVAAAYDDETAALSDDAVLGPQLDVLASLAGGGPALELAIGTGRVALPLSARGIDVVGIGLSRPMVADLRAKAGGDEARIPVAIGDMTSTEVPGRGSFALVYLVFNTIMNVTTQEGQLDCFRNAAGHLAPGGHFVVEVGVPDLRRLPPGERLVAFERTETHVGIDEYEPATQQMWSHHINVRPDGQVRRVTVPFRYVWPSELDLMARLAGLERVARWGDWTRTPFTSESRSHISVWQKPPREPLPTGTEPAESTEDLERRPVQGSPRSRVRPIR